MNVTLNPEVRARLDAHLDAVERALVEAKCSRERRRGIVDDLEAQIMEMLAARSKEPTVGDLEAVLATLDPPAAYGESAPSAGAPSVGTVSAISPPARAPVGASRYSRTAIWGFVCILVSLLPLLLAVPLLFFTATSHRTISTPAIRRTELVKPEAMVALPILAVPRSMPVMPPAVLNNLMGIDGLVL